MSGGYFGYSQYKLDYIADEIEQLIIDNNKPDEYGETNNFDKKTIAEFKEGLRLLEKAAIYAQRIDWLVSGDDAEDSFHERLAEEINKQLKESE